MRLDRQLCIDWAAPADDVPLRELAAQAGLRVDPVAQRHNAQARLLVARGGASSAIVVGFVLFWLLPGELEVLDLAVHPDFRRRGIATALLRRALKEGARAGACDAFLEVRVTGEAARSLYEKLGFLPIHRRVGYYPDGEDALVYQCCTTQLIEADSPVDSGPASKGSAC